MKNYVDKDKLQEFATKLHNKQKTIFATQDMVGSPLTASTVADMTDTNKVYVYTGSETGYTAGNWYYYNGSEWTSGGIYNSAAVNTDTTLSVAGKAADAKVTGNKINIFNNTFIGQILNETWARGSISSNTGAISSSTTRIYTNSIIEVDICLDITIPSGMKIYPHIYNENGQHTSGSEWYTESFRLNKGYYRFVAAYTDDSTIIESAGANITLTNNYTDNAKTEGEYKSVSAAVGTGGYTGAVGSKISQDSSNSWRRIKVLVGFNKKYRITYKTIDYSSGEIAYVFLCDKDDIILKRITGSYNNSITITNEITVDENIHYIYIRSYTRSTDDISVKEYKTEINNIKENLYNINNIISFIELPLFRTGSRLPNGTVIDTNGTSVTFFNGIYVGKGNKLYIKTAEHWRIGAYYGSAESGTWKKYNIPQTATELTTQDDYIYFNLTKVINGERQQITTTQVREENALILFVWNYDTGDSYKRDIPENIGVLNAICRAQQGSRIKYTTQAILPAQNGNISANTDITGIMYSSTRKESLYVPNNVSFDSYMTAIKNPNSYIYTRQSTNPNSKTYYGSVCSSFVSYCYDFPCVYTTHQIGLLDSIELRENQSAYGAKLADMFLKEDVHIAIITDIVKDNRGRIQYMEVTDSWPPYIRTRQMTVEQINTEYFNDGYKLYTYKDVYNVPYAPSQWVAVEDEDEPFPVYSVMLSPRRGDKANWILGETVEIDVLNAGEYTSVSLYKDNVLKSTNNIITGTVLEYNNLEAGSYKLRMTGDTDDINSVYFIVVETNINVEDLGNGTAKIYFSSSNAIPVWFSWCYSSGSDLWAVARAYELTSEDIENGYVITTFEAGEWMFKVEFKTEYGVHSSELVTATIT